MKYLFGRIFLLCCVVVASLCCGRGNKLVQTSYDGGEIVTLSDSLPAESTGDTVDLGRIREGEVVTRQMQLLNAGRVPLVILSVETSCGCTEVDFPRQPLAPGEKKPFSFTFDSRGFSGWQFKTITIRTSMNEQPYRLFVVATVE